MSPQLPLIYRPVVPAIELWVQHHERAAQAVAVPLSEAHQSELSPYFSEDVLARVRVAVTDDLPRAPIPSFGIRPLRAFLRGRFSGLTLRDTIFVRPNRLEDTGLFFHELVHVLQWQQLGLRPFIHAYGVGLLEGGYSGCSLELMAYRLEARFRKKDPVFAVEAEVRAGLAPPP